MAPRRVLVVGAGIFGVTAALELRRRGWSVEVVEPGPVPRPLASSTDRSKVIRADYGRDDFLTGEARDCLETWRRWNRERFDRPLFHETGFLLLSRGPMEPGGFEHDSFTALARRGSDVERLDADAIGRRFPAWNVERYPDGYLSREAGWAESGEVVRALAREGRAAGVAFVRERVRSLHLRSGRVEGVELSSGDVLAAERVVVAAGAWTARLLPETEMRASGLPVLLFAPRDPAAFQAPVFPVWGADIGRTGWYGFPAGEDGIVKIGHHGRGRSGDPEADGQVPGGWEARCRDFLADSLPGLADAPLAGSRVCYYCDSPDGHFWIAADPGRPGLVVASGGSGHGFKFAPLLGEWIADAVEERAPPERFRWRPGAPDGAEDARYLGD